MLHTYPSIKYDKNDLKDISRFYFIHSSDNMFTYHIIQDWISPEDLAYDYYGSCDFVWAILYFNDIVDPFNDWLKTDDEVFELTVKKYGRENISKIHHYEYEDICVKDPSELLLNLTKDSFKKVTNLEYEISLNDKKRYVRILNPSLIDTIEHEIKDKMQCLYNIE